MQLNKILFWNFSNKNVINILPLLECQTILSRPHDPLLLYFLCTTFQKHRERERATNREGNESVIHI